MKITLGQIRVYSNDVQRNFEQIETIINNHQDSDLIVFPQLALSGMYIGDNFKNESIVQDLLSYNDKIKDLSKDAVVIFGNIYYDDYTLYNAAFAVQNGEYLRTPVIKKRLSDYELQYFGIKDSDRYLTVDDKTLSITFDHKVWDDYSIVLGHDRALKENLPMIHNGVYINPVGIQNTAHEVYGFDGGSYISDGEHKHALNDNFQKEVITVDANHISPVTHITSHKTYHTLVEVIRAFDEEYLPHKPKWIIGVSGGLDSSVSVALLCDALGKDRVLGVTMPSHFTRGITKSNAQHLSDTLHFKMLTIPIAPMSDGTVSAFEGAGYPPLSGLTFENVQARLRGHTLMTLSSLENGVVCNNGNKIEVALGYATLYGDAIGALALLGDLIKLEVGNLAESINEIHEQEVIPKNLIPNIERHAITWDFAPSAELAQDQFDPMKWGYHDHLLNYILEYDVESLMSAYLNGTIEDTLPGKYLNAYGLDDPKRFIEDLEWFLRTMNTAVYKRVQSPPIIKLTELGFTNEVQSPRYESEKYRSLKEAILAL